jgi:hypothetical protein
MARSDVSSRRTNSGAIGSEADIPPSKGNERQQNAEHRGLSTNSNIEPGKSGRLTGLAQPYQLQDAEEQLTS